MKIYEKIKQQLNPRMYERRTFFNLLTCSFALLLFFIGVRVASNDVALSEFMSRTVNRWYNTAVGSFFSVFAPFSLYECFIFIAIASVLCLLTRMIMQFHRRFFYRAFSSLLVIVIAALSVMGIYCFTTSFEYNRAEMPIPTREREISLLDARTFAEDYVDELNRLATKFDFDGETEYVISPYSFTELSNIIKEEYKKVTDDYFSPYSPDAKLISCSRIMSNLHITGFAFSPFGEANINALTPPRSVPIVIAHEMAHIKGVMREDDANLLAYYICLNADNEFVRYCAYAYTLNNVISATYSIHDDYYSQLRQQVPKEVDRETAAASAFWREYSLFQDISNWVNDLYLKFNGTNGTIDYTDPGSTTNEPPEYVPAEEITISLSRVQQVIFNIPVKN